MLNKILAVLATAVAMMAALPASAMPTDRGVEISSDQLLERKRETCWRTNRSTKQKFKIC